MVDTLCREGNGHECAFSICRSRSLRNISLCDLILKQAVDVIDAFFDFFDLPGIGSLRVWDVKNIQISEHTCWADGSCPWPYHELQKRCMTCQDGGIYSCVSSCTGPITDQRTFDMSARYLHRASI